VAGLPPIRRQSPIGPKADRQAEGHRLDCATSGKLWRRLPCFATLRDVLEHYNSFFKLALTEQQKVELIEYLKSL